MVQHLKRTRYETSPDGQEITASYRAKASQMGHFVTNTRFRFLYFRMNN